MSEELGRILERYVNRCFQDVREEIVEETRRLLLRYKVPLERIPEIAVSCDANGIVTVAVGEYPTDAAWN